MDSDKEMDQRNDKSVENSCSKNEVSPSSERREADLKHSTSVESQKKEFEWIMQKYSKAFWELVDK